MPVDTHGRWPWASAALVAPGWAAVFAGRDALRQDDAWVAMLLLPILLAHQTEEWVRPGGFLPFCNERLLGSDRPTWPLTERDAYHVNVTLGWGTAIAAAACWRRSAVPAAVVLWMEVGNAALHAGMAARERRYNPGLLTGVALMAVHAAAGFRTLHRSGRLGRRGALAAFALGVAIDAGLPVTMRRRMSGGRGLSAATARPSVVAPGRFSGA